MRNFRIVAAMEFRRALRSRSFLVISVMMALSLLGAAVFVFMTTLSGGSVPDVDIPEMLIDIMPDQTGIKPSYVVAVEDRTGLGLVDELEKRLPRIDFARCELTDEVIEDALESGVDGCAVLTSELDFDFYGKSAMYGQTVPDMISSAMEKLAREKAFAGLGVSSSDASRVMSMNAWYSLHTIGGYGINEYFINTFISVLLFIMITLYGQMVAMRVTAEKGSRTIEVLATSVSPVDLLCGKVVGVGAAAMLQTPTYLLLTGLLALYSVSRSADLAALIAGIGISGWDVLLLCAYFLLGFTLNAFLYGGLGAMVSQPEDLSGLASLPTTLLMGGYLIGIVCTSTGTPNLLLRIASFVPFWSPVVMFSRMSMEEVRPAEIIVSLALLVGMIIVAARLAARLYRRGMLRYGKPPKLRELLDAMKK